MSRLITHPLKRCQKIERRNRGRSALRTSARNDLTLVEKSGVEERIELRNRKTRVLGDWTERLTEQEEATRGGSWPVVHKADPHGSSKKPHRKLCVPITPVPYNYRVSSSDKSRPVYHRSALVAADTPRRNHVTVQDSRSISPTLCVSYPYTRPVLWFRIHSDWVARFPGLTSSRPASQHLEVVGAPRTTCSWGSPRKATDLSGPT
ncbi:hypothetical protein RRG08_012303 [Elysia crispata]|uniref:Uncharacterized protein n=1 Tax=Elysia crispata TaxID=231223 RepID=A0AAE1BB57_9GAST|nr:hypothetical protein RRG08_012303 [Elysia crispata]